MAYPLRLCFEGAIYHVTARGDNREPVFLDATDYQQYLLILRRYQTSPGFTLHAYALMPNHVHLLLAPANGTTISRIMQCMTSIYTRWFNHRQGRIGHVFQGRFHSRLIERDHHLLAASRYVHLNPVRAGLARHPSAYVWSSYGAYEMSMTNPLGLVDPSTVLALMGEDAHHQREAYRAFIESALPQASDGVFEVEQPIVGSVAFVQAVQKQYGVQFHPRGRPRKEKCL